MASPISGSKIIGGSSADISEAPYVAGIVQMEPDGTLRRVCTGSLIRDNVVITTANCIHPDRMYFVTMGVTQWSDITNPYFQVQAVMEIHIHPDYTPNPRPQFDIALLILNIPRP